MPPQLGALLRPLPRRAPVVAQAHIRPRAWRHEVEQLQVSLLRMLLRIMSWSFSLMLLGLAILWDSLLRRRTPESDGARIARVFERLGGTATKLGQQLSVRVDMLPFEVCEALGRLRDRMPPMPFEEAKTVVERHLGRPIEARYEAFQEEPIGSASIACVYKARLRSGEEVAVKVKRQGVARRFAADLRCLDIGTRLLELLGIVRPDFFRFLRRDLRLMFAQELDFMREAQHQRLFRRMVRKDRITEFDAPHVWSELTSRDVLVTSFVHGTPIDVLVRARETHDSEALERLSSDGIDPQRAARQVLALAFWGRYECPFFHSDPHPGNLIIEPGGRLIVLDFGSCCHRPSRVARLDQAFMRNFVADDIEAVVDVSLASMAPIERIDLNELRRKMEGTFWRARLVDLSKDADWWERTTTTIQLAIMEALQDFNIPVGSQLLAFLRSSMLYDTLAFRLDPKLQIAKAHKKYARKAFQRRARRSERRLSEELQDGLSPLLLAEVKDLAHTAQRASFWVGSLSLQPRATFVRTLAKSAFALLVLLRLAGVAVALTAAGAVFLWMTGHETNPGVLVGRVLAHPIYIALAVPLLALALRRVWLEITDPDP